LRAHRMPRVWWRTIALVFVLSAGCVAAVAIRRSQSLARQAFETPPPPSRGAFLTGGRPPPDPVVERLLASDLPAFLIALDRRHELRNKGAGADEQAAAERTLQEARARLQAADAARVLGATGTKRFGELISSAEAASSQRATEDDDHPFLRATGAFDDE